MVVSRPLATWLWLLQTKPPLSVRQWLWATLLGSRGSQALMVVANLMLFMAAVRADSMKDAAAGTLMCCGFYSCNSAQAVYLLRRPRARTILAGMLEVAAAVEVEASEDAQRALSRAGRGIFWLTALQLGYATGMVLSVWAHVLMTAHAYAPMWPPPPLPGQWGERAVAGFEMVAMFVGCLGYFSLVTLFGCMSLALTGLYSALSLRLKAARGLRQVIRVVQLHQQLNREARAAELFFADVIAHLMVAILVVPLVATLQVVFNVVDPLTFMSSSILVSVFLPMAAISQELTDASSSMGRSAYDSAFPDGARRPLLPAGRRKDAAAPPSDASLRAVARAAAAVDSDTRRALLLVMVSARRPARISLKGFGPVSLVTAGKALRVWYQWGNMLVSVSSG